MSESDTPECNEAFECMYRDSMAKLLGIEIVAAEPGYAEVRLPVTPKILNGHDTIHGGALFTLADFASSIAANRYGQATVAASGSIFFLKSCNSGVVTAKAKTVKAGKRMKFQLVEVFTGTGELMATFQGSSITVSSKPSAKS